MAGSNCRECVLYTQPQHCGDIGCAVQSAYSQLFAALEPNWHVTSHFIEPCTDWQAKQQLPYDPEQPCIRCDSSLQNWGYLGRVQGGWNETAAFFGTLGELLQTMQVSIVDAFHDDTGLFFTVAANHAADHASSPHMIPVESSIMEACGYDLLTQTLQIRFLPRNGGTGRTYQYSAVPAQKWQELLSAESKGRYFCRYIKGHYNYTEV
jgi:KTSC domain